MSWPLAQPQSAGEAIKAELFGGGSAWGEISCEGDSHARTPTRSNMPPGRQSWMFTKEQLESAPSLQDGMPLQQERAVRNSTCKFIQKVGQHTHPACKPMSVSTARVFFHRVCMSQSVVEGRQNPKLLGVACLFLACKSEEELKPVREFIWSMNQIACEVDAHGKATYPYGTFAGDAAKPVDRHGRRRKPWMVEEETSEFQKVKENILQVERLILQVLDFDFTVRHPIAHIRVRACIPCNPTSALASSLLA